MNVLKKIHDLKNWLFTEITLPAAEGDLEIQRLKNVHSRHLGRAVIVDVFLPPGYFQHKAQYPLLVFNDGQDMEAVGMTDTLQQLWASGELPPIAVAAVHAADRLQEYGTAGRLDYASRGSKAAAYTQFVTEELLPLLQQRYRLLPSHSGRHAIAGFSLGGLSAFDIAWHQAHIFSKVGVFSGALWWRATPFNEAAPDAHRIIHELVAQGPKRKGMSFWFQAGTKDEASDRNNNGVIDAIDDTLDLMAALRQIGYADHHLHYREVEGGEHNTDTWAKVLPAFLLWAFEQSR